MKLVILAAGEGIRMRPLTLTAPKPLLLFGGKCALERLFEALPPEITEVIIAVNYLGEQIRAFCGSEYYGRKIIYVEGSATGNATGFINAHKYFTPGERLAVSYGDEIITREEIEACLARPFSWLCYEMENPKGVGVARVDNQSRIVEVLEKPEVPPSHLVANGFMVASTELFNYLPEKNANGEYYFSSLMNEFCKHHEVFAVQGHKEHAQISTPEDLMRLDERYKNT